MSLVKFTLSKKFGKFYEGVYPFKEMDTLLFIGEIVNMPGHCVVVPVNKSMHNSGVVFTGFHTDNFEEIKKEDV